MLKVFFFMFHPLCPALTVLHPWVRMVTSAASLSVDRPTQCRISSYTPPHHPTGSANQSRGYKPNPFSGLLPLINRPNKLHWGLGRSSFITKTAAVIMLPECLFTCGGRRGLYLWFWHNYLLSHNYKVRVYIEITNHNYYAAIIAHWAHVINTETI